MSVLFHPQPHSSGMVADPRIIKNRIIRIAKETVKGAPGQWPTPIVAIGGAVHLTLGVTTLGERKILGVRIDALESQTASPANPPAGMTAMIPVIGITQTVHGCEKASFVVTT